MTNTAYDALAPHYRDFARTRAAYCDSVDRRLTEWLPARVDAMLDVGAGDGHRAVRLASAFGAARLVLVDPSRPMVDLCRAHIANLSAPDSSNSRDSRESSDDPVDPVDVTESRSRAAYQPPRRIEIWNCEAEALPVPSERFDVITCLWNVLGAVDSTPRRLEALRRMAALLAPGGRLYLDVHNRYNVSTAGLWSVMGRLVIDAVRPTETNGVVRFTWRVAGQQIRSHGYLFTRRELIGLVAAAGLRMTREVFVDYADGRTRGPWTGQMLVCLEHADER